MIILFDVDGVLIRNRAYHAALTQTVQYFSRRMGVGEHTVTEDDIIEFESQSVTVEWDSGAICVAALLVDRLRAAPDRSAGPGPSLWAALDQLGAHPVRVARPDFAALARRVGAATPPGTLPSHAALGMFKSESADVPQVHPLLQQLLSHCYDIDLAPAMQVFQNYAIGHEQYAHYYELPPHFECEPLLEKLDQSALAPEWRDRLLALQAEGKIHIVIYTARPSLAPLDGDGAQRGFTPEAETARHIVGLDPVPVMAFGKLDWMAHRVGLPGADGAGFIKPGSFHSVAALATARTGHEVEALKAAFAVERGWWPRYPLTACAHETVHVFEDSTSSLRAVSRAIARLNREGMNLRLVRHGIGAEGSPKRAALAEVADVVHADVNEGLAAVLGSLRG